jgi:phosphatidate cytidylyltransferase
LVLTRILTAAVLIAGLLAALLLLGQRGFEALVAAMVALGAREWGKLSGVGRGAALAFAAACVLAYALLVQLPEAREAAMLAAAAFWLLAVPRWLRRGLPASRAATLLAGVLVLVPAGAAMAALTRAELLLLLGLAWVADTVAFFVGRAFGRRKLAPGISPGKTWEGALGGGLGCLIYATICAMLVPGLNASVQGAAWAPYLGGAALLCAAGIAGDLLESALKRRAGVKDSGALLPGHGGVLDRIDSATATLPLGLLMLGWLGAR